MPFQEHGGDLSADAIELQLKDNHREMVTAASFNSQGRERTISEYGLTPGAQRHIWAIFVDDTAARIQREATARILQPTGELTSYPAESHSHIMPTASGDMGELSFFEGELC